jgi:hypothetical protein
MILCKPNPNTISPLENDFLKTHTPESNPVWLRLLMLNLIMFALTPEGVVLASQIILNSIL